MTTKETIAALRQEAFANPAAKELFTLWSKRERARHRVTIAALRVKMKTLGFNFTDDQLCAVLRMVAGLGFGNIMEDGRGKLLALVGVNTSLQTIGAAALGSDEPLKSSKARRKFKTLATAEPKIVTVPEPAPVVAAAAPAAPAATVIDQVWNGPELDGVVSVAMVIHGRTVQLAIPRELTPEETADIVRRLLHTKAA